MFEFILEKKPLPTHFSDIIFVIIWMYQEYLEEIHSREVP